MDVFLTLNAGSSTLKAAVFTAEEKPARLLSLLVEIPVSYKPSLPGSSGQSMDYPNESGNDKQEQISLRYRRSHETQWQSHSLPQADSVVAALLQLLPQMLPDAEIKAIGHRVVHGGEHYTQPVQVNEAVLSHLRRLAPLAPLHLPPEIAAIESAASAHPDIPQIACFDTAFHATQPRLARLFALPVSYAQEGVLRYGFHGLSYEYIASVLPEDIGPRVVVAHLGNGASMCAMREKKSIATSMGFSALDGLMMGTRCGSIDPGVLLYLMEAKQMNAREIGTLLYKESGLLGVSSISGDMRELEASDAPQAKEAIELFCYRAAAELGKLVMVLGGLDALVFTGGIGENSQRVREGILAYTAWLGEVKNLVIPTDEEAMMAGHMAGTCHYRFRGDDEE